MRTDRSLATLDAPSPIPACDHGSYPVRPGNAVSPLIGGLRAFRRICAAIEAACQSVWLTIAFIAPDFLMPDARGSLFDVLDRAAARGLDVRVIFWRPDPAATALIAATFSGTPQQRAMLAARGSRFRARWDLAGDAVCHHQKSWLINAGGHGEIAFVGGMNLDPRLVAPSGPPAGAIHDLYLELSGPAATDVHHNFVQRWNEASERGAEDGVWGHDGQDELAFPNRLSPVRGAVPVQIQRTIHAGLYRDGRAAPGAPAFAIAAGERAILDQYLRAITAAKRSIYIENQAMEVAEIVAALDAALRRGVGIVVLVPAEPESRVRTLRASPQSRDFYAQLAALGRHDAFALVGLAAPGGTAGRHPIYVHAKIMLVDDAWGTIGSGNLHRGSMFRQTEMNAAFWHPETVRALRCALFSDHLACDTADRDDRAALTLFREIARSNRREQDAGGGSWQGRAFDLDPATYAG